MATGQPYDKAFKLEAVYLVQSSGKSMRQIAEELGVSLSAPFGDGARMRKRMGSRPL